MRTAVVVLAAAVLIIAALAGPATAGAATAKPRARPHVCYCPPAYNCWVPGIGSLYWHCG
jgi:hypothetical protein